MNLASIIVAVVIAGLFIAAVRHTIKNRGCSGCNHGGGSSCCENCHSGDYRCYYSTKQIDKTQKHM